MMAKTPKEFKKERHNIEVYLFPEEFEILKELADADKESYSEYLRLAFMFDAVTRGNVKAIKLTSLRGVEKLKKKWIQYGVLAEELTLGRILGSKKND